MLCNQKKSAGQNIDYVTGITMSFKLCVKKKTSEQSYTSFSTILFLESKILTSHPSRENKSHYV